MREYEDENNGFELYHIPSRNVLYWAATEDEVMDFLQRHVWPKDHHEFSIGLVQDGNYLGGLRAYNEGGAMREDPLTKIDEFATYKKDWDTYGAPPIDPKVIVITKDIITMIKTGKLDVTPMSSGGISISWRTEDFYIEVEPDSISCGYYSRDHGELYSDGSHKAI